MLWEDKKYFWLTETFLSNLISSTSHERVPIQCSSLLLCHGLCHRPIYRTLSWQVFFYQNFSASFILPLLLLGPHCHSFSLLCSVCGCLCLIERSQHWHNVVAIHKTDYLPSIYKVLKPISVNSHSKHVSLIESWYFENTSEIAIDIIFRYYC